MKQLTNIIAFLLLLPPFSGLGQWADSFSDGELNNNPAWQGDLSDFTIEAGVLQLNAAAAGDAILYTGIQPDASASWVWEFKIKHGFSGSSNNHSRIFLWSQTADFYSGEDAALSPGYYLQFGESGSDDAVELFRIDSGSTEPVSICRGPDGSISSSFENKYRIIYSQGTWQIWSGSWNGPYYALETAGQDLAGFTTGYFALLLNYTGSNTANFYFDDIKTAAYSPDLTPPGINTLSVLNATQLLLFFTEAVDSTALEQSRYLVNGASPIETDFGNIDQDRVSLEWAVNFTENQLLTLTIDTLEDIAGNMAFNLSFDFTWNPPFEADSAGLLFNEVLPDPTPIVGLPDAEFIELYNTTDSIINLAGYTLFNSSVPMALPAYFIQPDDYLILCNQPETLLFESFGPVLGLSPWPALVNSGDSLTLVNASGKVLDVLVYDDSWYGDAEKAEGGWSLERIHPVWPCDVSANWRASENALGGTPGQINAVFNNAVDTIAPEIMSIQIINDESLLLNLTEAPENTYLTPGQIVIPGLEILTIEYAESPVSDLLLMLASPMEENTNYVARLENVQDCWGNISQDSLVFNSGFFAQPGDVVFNELMPDPTPPQLLPEAEFIELFNTTGKSFNSFGWELENSGIRKSIPPFIFGPEALIILCREEDTTLFSGYGQTIGMPSWSALANTRDSLGLINEKGDLIAQVVYTDSWYKNESKSNGGWSLERIDPGSECNGKINWMASENTSGGTPGKTNSVNGFPLENKISLWQVVFADTTALIASFTGEPDTASVFNSAYQMLPDLGLSKTGFTMLDDGFTLDFALNNSPVADLVYQFSISGIESCNQESISTLSIDFGLASPAAKNDIVINEILFHPFSGGSDFIELMNVSTHFIDIGNWRILKADSIEISDESILGIQHLILPPGGLLAISSVPEELPELYPLSTDASKLFYLPGLPNFSNDEGVIILKDHQLNTIDSLRYSEDMHFSLLDDLKGISLERIIPTGPTTDPLNWTSASEAVGYATPGRFNSQLFKPGVSGAVVLEPELFTPDNDGYHDQLHINYQLSDGGWMGTIRIFSDRGIEVRRLLNNDWLGTEGSKAWDGTDNNGEKAPVGIYIVYFELFNAQGEKQLFKQTCVLGSKL